MGTYRISGVRRRVGMPAITNTALLACSRRHLDAIVGALDDADLVELGPETLLVHRRRGDEPPR